MIPELGHFALILALPVSFITGVLAIWGAAKNDQRKMSMAQPGVRLLAFLVTFSYVCLTWAFIGNDFSVLYVASHSNSHLPLVYRIAGVWGGHEGSLLLWMLMLTWWALAVSIFSRQLSNAMLARVLGTLALVGFGFLLFILLTSNPFTRLLPAAADGNDLNPLLQDPGLVIHPPLLYMGYVGFSVAYAFAVAALLAGKLDTAWARWSRPWTTLAWVFLTLGIACGSLWAYYELGWGGWWFWDPVENASFMPWLAGTALMHSLAVTEKRGSFKNWTVLLAISAFSLSLLGTFLVRSGVLTSVHAFATDPARGIFILAFLAIVIGISLALFVWRAPGVGLGGRFAPFSRESLLLINNVLLIVGTGTVLLGTLYPLLIEALHLGQISVGPPYFDAVFAPLMLPLLFVLGVGPYMRWKKDEPKKIAKGLRWPLILAILAGAALPFAWGRWSPMVALSLALASWILFATLWHIADKARAKKSLSMPLHYWGMQLAHIGVAVFVAGVAVVGGYATEKDVKMAQGDTVHLDGREFLFHGLKQVEGPNYTALQGEMDLLQGNEKLRTLHPEKRFYQTSGMPMTEASVASGPLGDWYVSLGEPIDREKLAGDWVVRVYHKPLVTWIWYGCILMAIGGMLALADKRYRRIQNTRKEQ
jgi:cytochrome c-type biogenesis protein CcmF